jgi:hypothetical protein
MSTKSEIGLKVGQRWKSKHSDSIYIILDTELHQGRYVGDKYGGFYNDSAINDNFTLCEEFIIDQVLNKYLSQ